MSDQNTRDFDLDILTCLEDKETKLLSWGIVDGGFTEDELYEHIRFFAEQIGDPRDVDEIKASMLDRVLITQVVLTTGNIWRTRMAETIRLIVRVRQLFYKHMKANNQWKLAPNLVSDYRFVTRKRLFPRREIAPEIFVDSATQKIDNTNIRTSLKALTEDFAGFAPFQLRACQTILNRIDSKEPTATLVSAGTGSGKTKAVYLPALSYLSSIKSDSHWTKMLALYPRNELLKDQLRVALIETRHLRKKTGLSLSIGTFFGGTPKSLFSIKKEYGWKEKNGKRICPFLTCLECESELYLFEDRGSTELRCVNTTCNGKISSQELFLTRKQQAETPPDLLLTSVEMLNRQIQNDEFQKIFGVEMPETERPKLLLLDEAHTYSGLAGAQVALLLRRWRHAVGNPVHTVGLSATLLDGETFFGDLSSTNPNEVTVVEPTNTEMEPDSKEYLIALRGNPAARSALLSTTIQTTMLLRRCLDSAKTKVSINAFGTKLFAFTDKLDLTNRFAHFLRNAEGQKDSGIPDPNKSQYGSLANLRNSVMYGQADERREDGQSWDLVEQIGHKLLPNNHLRIERTSSQDPGFSKNSDIVVATASLEVGLDDDSVGAVVQHKAPKDSASFIQRRGRAGRTREMRPWTAIVLSDYGQDRISFQAWDSLFDPQLNPLRLPLENRYVLRIQATYSLLDWLAIEIRPFMRYDGFIWEDLTGPITDSDSLHGDEERRKHILEKLVLLTEDKDSQNRLLNHLVNSLSISKREAKELLWAPPRAVLASVVPTLIRRLQSSWNNEATENEKDLHSDQRHPPLPDFLPKATFEDLLLPEVEICFPDPDRDSEIMGVESALREFTHGKITHRFALGWSGERLWLSPSQATTSVDETFVCDELDVVKPIDSAESIKILRPTKILPSQPSVEILSSSSGFPIWGSNFSEFGNPLKRKVPTYAGVEKIIPELNFSLHKSGSYMKVYRFSTGSTGIISKKDSQEIFETNFRDEEGPVGIGYRIDVDCIKFVVNTPKSWGDILDDNPYLKQSLLASWFKHCIIEDPSLKSLSSVFLRQWISELSLIAITQSAVQAKNDLSKGISKFKQSNLAETIDHILQVVFLSTIIDPESEVEDESLDVTKLHSEIVEFAKKPEVIRSIKNATKELLKLDIEAFNAWLSSKYTATIAGAVAHAVSLLHEEINVDDLVVDIDPWSEDQPLVYLSERKPGGVGILETAYQAYNEDPPKFWRLFVGLGSESEGESIDQNLTRFVSLATSNEAVINEMARLRSSETHQERLERLNSLDDVLVENHLNLTIAARVARNTRFLRPGSNFKTDKILSDFLTEWSTLEKKLGLEIDPRTFAHLKSHDEELDEGLNFENVDVSDTWRFNAILSLLWPRGSFLRSQPLTLWQSFQNNPIEPDRLLLHLQLIPLEEVILSSKDDFSEKLSDKLTVDGTALLRTPRLSTSIKDTLLKTLVTPVEHGVIELFPRIVEFKNINDDISIEFEIPEIYL